MACKFEHLAHKNVNLNMSLYIKGCQLLKLKVNNLVTQKKTSKKSLLIVTSKKILKDEKKFCEKKKRL